MKAQTLITITVPKSADTRIYTNRVRAIHNLFRAYPGENLLRLVVVENNKKYHLDFVRLGVGYEDEICERLVELGCTIDDIDIKPLTAELASQCQLVCGAHKLNNGFRGSATRERASKPLTVQLARSYRK